MKNLKYCPLKESAYQTKLLCDEEKCAWYDEKSNKCQICNLSEILFMVQK